MPKRRRFTGRARTDHGAVDLYRAFVVGVDTAEDLDQRALAGTVLTGENVHLAGPGLEVDPFQYAHRAELLADAAHAQPRRGQRRSRRLPAGREEIVVHPLPGPSVARQLGNPARLLARHAG